MEKRIKELKELTNEIKFQNDVNDITDYLWYLQKVSNIIEKLTYKDMSDICTSKINVDFDLNNPKYRLVNGVPNKEWLDKFDEIEKYRQEVFREAHKRFYMKWYEERGNE